MKLAFVLTGWYVKNSTINSDIKETIRVIGGSLKRPDYFQLSDGSEMSEYEILNYWTYMPTTASKDNNQNTVVIGDLSENESIKSEVAKFTDYVKSNPNSNSNQSLKNDNNIPLLENHQPIEQVIEFQPIKSENEIFIDKLLDSVVSQTDFEIEIPIKFTFKYDIKKLKQIISIINSDDMKVKLFIDKIIQSQKTKINNRIEEKLMDYFLFNDDEIKPTQLSNQVTKATKANKYNKFLDNF